MANHHGILHRLIKLNPQKSPEPPPPPSSTFLIDNNRNRKHDDDVEIMATNRTYCNNNNNNNLKQTDESSTFVIVSNTNTINKTKSLVCKNCNTDYYSYYYCNCNQDKRCKCLCTTRVRGDLGGGGRGCNYCSRQDQEKQLLNEDISSVLINTTNNFVLSNSIIRTSEPENQCLHGSINRCVNNNMSFNPNDDDIRKFLVEIDNKKKQTMDLVNLVDLSKAKMILEKREAADAAVVFFEPHISSSSSSNNSSLVVSTGGNNRGLNDFDEFEVVVVEAREEEEGCCGGKNEVKAFDNLTYLSSVEDLTMGGRMERRQGDDDGLLLFYCGGDEGVDEEDQQLTGGELLSKKTLKSIKRRDRMRKEGLMTTRLGSFCVDNRNIGKGSSNRHGSMPDLRFERVRCGGCWGF